MKETKLKNWQFDIGTFTYKIPKDKQEEIKSSSKKDLLIKYNMYVIYQGSKGIDHYISIEDFEKIYNKCKNSSKDTLKEYTNNLVKDKVSDAISVYVNHIYQNSKSVTFLSSYNPNHKITYKFIDKDIVKVEEVTDLENLDKFNKDYKLKPDRELPLLVFVSEALAYKYYPGEDNIYLYCKKVSADFNSALNIIYDHRGRKYVV